MTSIVHASVHLTLNEDICSEPNRILTIAHFTITIPSNQIGVVMLFYLHIIGI